MKDDISGIIINIKGYNLIIDKDELWRIEKYKYYPSNNRGYIYLRRCGKNMKRIYLHREIMNTQKDVICDHINGNTLDNRKCNLRNCTSKQNSWNHGKNKRNKTGVTGVSFDKTRNLYQASIRYNGKSIGLGRYKTIKEARQVYNDATIKYFGRFARIK